MAPENNGPVLVVGVAQNLVQLNGEAVEVANVEWAEVGVEGVVQQGAVNGEVDGRRVGLGWRSRTCLSLGRALAWRPALLGGGVGEGSLGVGRRRVRGEIQAVFNGCLVTRILCSGEWRSSYPGCTR